LGRNVLRASFTELTDKVAESWGHWLFAKEAPQTFSYLSANGLIVLSVNVQVTHLSAHAPAVARRAGLSPEKVRPQEGDQRGTKPP